MYTSIIKPIIKPILKPVLVDLAIEHGKDLVTKGVRSGSELVRRKLEKRQYERRDPVGIAERQARHDARRIAEENARLAAERSRAERDEVRAERKKLEEARKAKKTEKAAPADVIQATELDDERAA